MWEVVRVERDGSVATVFEGVAVLSDDSVVVARRRFGPGHGGSCSVSARAGGWAGVEGYWGREIRPSSRVGVCRRLRRRRSLGLLPVLDDQRADGCRTGDAVDRGRVLASRRGRVLARVWAPRCAGLAGLRGFRFAGVGRPRRRGEHRIRESSKHWSEG